MVRLVALSFFATSLTFANEKVHTIGIEYSYSDIKRDNSDFTSELNDSVTSHYSATYQYQVSQYFALGFGFLNGDSSDADGIIIDAFTDSKLDYSAVLLSAAANYPISKRSYLYFKVDALQYDYDIIDDSLVVNSEVGDDFAYSFGWMFKFDNGIGIKAGYEVLNMGDHIDIKGFNTGISYRF